MEQITFDYLCTLKKELIALQERIFMIERFQTTDDKQVKFIKGMLKNKNTSGLTMDDYAKVYKKCTVCHNKLNLNQYHRCKLGKYLRHARCKNCTKNHKVCNKLSLPNE